MTETTQNILINENLSGFRRFARVHPIASIALMVTGVPLLFIPTLLFGRALYREWGRILPGKEKSDKPENKFEEREIKLSEIDHTISEDQDQVLAKLTHYNDLPVLEIYTTDPKLQARAQGRLMATYFINFYLRYLKVAEFGFSLITKGSSKEEEKQMKKKKVGFIAKKVAQRIEFPDDVKEEKKIFLEEFNQAVVEHNSSAKKRFRIKEFTEGQLDMLYAGCDIVKGLGTKVKPVGQSKDGSEIMTGCSALVREVKKKYDTKKGSVENKSVEHGRTVDWWSGGALADYTMAVMRHTPYADDTNSKKPKKTFEITFVPGANTLSVANDKGLVITLNELGTMSNMRTEAVYNEDSKEHKKATPQYIIMRQIAQECSTVSEIKEYLDNTTFAAPFVITASDNDGGGGIFEILPPKCDERILYRDLQDDDASHPCDFSEQLELEHESYVQICERQKKLKEAKKEYGPAQTVTNHTHNKPETSTVPCSLARKEALDSGAHQHLPLKSIFAQRPVNGPSSVQTMRFKRKYDAERNTVELNLRFNWRNKRSGGVDGENDPLAKKAEQLAQAGTYNESYASDGFTKINLSEQFVRFK